MSDNIDVLKRLALLIRNATAEGENTAERVGRTFVGIIDLLSEISLDKLKELFLRKDQEDQLVGRGHCAFHSVTRFCFGRIGNGVYREKKCGRNDIRRNRQADGAHESDFSGFGNHANGSRRGNNDV